ncbi:MAG: BrnT family toxin [Desulfobulbaceae bacterium]|nr:BrnT family toxin [Desulfobulbaceae bacterium]
MKAISFEWNDKKAESNLAKHNISFDEAQTAFFDTSARMVFDPDHSEQEDRFILLGLSSLLRLLVVCHCCHDANGGVIRIISARKANKNE